MPCTPLPTLALPTLPAPLTLTPPAPPSIDFDPSLCCKLLPFPVTTPPVPLPVGVLNPAVVAVLTQQMAAAQSFLDSLSFSCPRE
jgi:hypothetical protein